MSEYHHAAIARLFKQNGPAYLAYAERILRTNLRGYAEDVVQTSMVRLMKAAPKHETLPNHAVVLWTIRKAALDVHRANGRRGDMVSFDAEFGDGSGQSLYDVVGDWRSAEQSRAVSGKEAFALVLETVNGLPASSAQRKAWDVRVAAEFDPETARKLVAETDSSPKAWSRHTTNWGALKRRLEAALREHGFDDVL